MVRRQKFSEVVANKHGQTLVDQLARRRKKFQVQMEKRREPKTQNLKSPNNNPAPKVNHFEAPKTELDSDEYVKEAFTTFISHEKSFSLLVSLFQIMLLLSPSPSVKNKKEMAELHNKVLEMWYKGHDHAEPIDEDDEMEINSKQDTNEPGPSHDGSY
jgi:hypothetical protein